MQSISTFLADYPYLGNAMMMVVLSVAGLALARSQRLAATFSGLLSLPWGIWGIALVPEYWTPRLLINIGRSGFEDFIWAFATGALAWLVAAIPARHHLMFDNRLASAVRRYANISIVGAVVFLPLWLAGIGVMTAFVVSNVALAIFLTFVRPGLLRLAVGGAIGFALINALVMKATFVIDPDYYLQMSSSTLRGVRVGEFLLAELAWALATGAVWPMVVSYVLEPASPKE